MKWKKKEKFIIIYTNENPIDAKNKDKYYLLYTALYNQLESNVCTK